MLSWGCVSLILGPSTGHGLNLHFQMLIVSSENRFLHRSFFFSQKKDHTLNINFSICRDINHFLTV